MAFVRRVEVEGYPIESGRIGRGDQDDERRRALGQTVVAVTLCRSLPNGAVRGRVRSVEWPVWIRD